MEKFLEIGLPKFSWTGFFHGPCVFEPNFVKVADLNSDNDLENIQVSGLMPERTRRPIKDFAFTSKGDPVHKHFPCGRNGDMKITSHTIGVEPYVKIYAGSISDIVRILTLLAHGKVPKDWTFELGYRMPGSCSCAYGDYSYTNKPPRNIDLSRVSKEWLSRCALKIYEVRKANSISGNSEDDWRQAEEIALDQPNRSTQNIWQDCDDKLVEYFVRVFHHNRQNIVYEQSPRFVVDQVVQRVRDESNFDYGTEPPMY